MTNRRAIFLRIRWLAVLLLSLMWTTMGNASALAERGDFGQCTLAAKSPPHKNSLDYFGETYVYRLKGPDGTTHKIGESAQVTRVRDGASIRAEQQARALRKETGDNYESEIRKTFPDKASARDYETRVIERFLRMYGDDTLPGNKTNR